MVELDYRTCSRCGETTIMLSHYVTESLIEVNPLPHPEGTIQVNFQEERCRVVPIKHMKKYAMLWRPHVATCKEVK